MVEFTYPMILDTIRTLGITVGISYYVLTLRNQTKARQAQLVAQLYDKYSDPEWLRHFNEPWTRKWEDIEDYMQKYSPQVNPDYRINFSVMRNFFEILECF